MKKLNRPALFFFLLLTAGVCFAQSASEYEKGVGFYARGEYQKAAETLQRVVEADEKDKKAWLYLGMSEAKLKNVSKAAKALRNAVKTHKGEAKNEAPTTDDAAHRMKIISKPRAQYTDAARRSQTQGTIRMAIEFGADGNIKEIFVFEGLPDGLTKSSVEAAKNIKFEPGTKDGKPFSTIAVISYNFVIY